MTYLLYCLLLLLNQSDLMKTSNPSPLVVISIPPEDAHAAICCNVPLLCDSSCHPPAWQYNAIMMPLCQCDSLCELFGDCCSNYQQVTACHQSVSESMETGSGSELFTFASGSINAADLKPVNPLVTMSPELLSSKKPSLSTPVIPSDYDTIEDEGGGQSVPSATDYSSFNIEYSWGADLEFAMVQSCVATSYRHTYEATSLTANIGAYMVSMCPSVSDILPEHQDLCESLDYAIDFESSFDDVRENFAEYLPVSDIEDHSVHYKNMYCAYCNGVSVENMLPWSLNYLDYSPASYWFEPLEEAKIRRCFSNSLLRRPSLLHDIPLADKCKTRINQTDQATGCISCFSTWETCYKLPSTLLEEPLAIPFDFRSYASKAIFRSSHIITCPKRFHYSEEEQECLPNEQLKSVSASCGQSELVSSSYFVNISFTSSDPESTSNEIIKRFALHMNYSLGKIKNTSISDEIFEIQTERCKRTTANTMCENEVTKRLHFEVLCNNSLGCNITQTRYKIDELPLVLRNISVVFHWIEYIQPCGPFSALDCKGEIFNSDLASLMKSNDTLLTKHRSSDNKMYVADHMMSKVTYNMQSYDDLNMQLEDVQDQIILCNSEEVLECPSISIDKSSYILNEVNNHLRIVSTGETFQPYQYIMLENRTALVCYTGAGVWKQLSRVMFYIYIIGTSISLVALALTFLTYCALSALRTVPGIATMNFIVASFVAQFGLLIGGRRYQDTPIQLCTFIAILLHYVWLASFFWTTALAFDVSRTLGTGMQPGPGGRGKKLFFYSIFSWGGPLILVLPSLLFHFCNCDTGACCTRVSFTYGTNDVCWIRPQTANLVAFGVPVMASLVFNIGLFTRTVSGVRSTKRATSMIERRRVSVVQRAMNEFTIYIKVSMLMGFSWIWGFLFGFTGIPALWTIFVIFNSVQGIFTFWAFACSARVWGMMKQRFRPPSSSSRNTRTPNDYLATESQTRTKRISVFSVNALKT